MSDILEFVRKWKEEIDRLNAETDERLRKYLEDEKMTWQDILKRKKKKAGEERRSQTSMPQVTIPNPE